MGAKTDNVIRLQDHLDGVSAGVRSVLNSGRYELVTGGPNPEFGFIGSDPYETNSGTGLIVPATPSAAINNERYLLVLARARFGHGEQSSDKCGVRLVGIRQYAELIARIPSRVCPPLSDTAGPEIGATVVFRKEITSPMWHFPDGDISWHVMIVNRVLRDTRNPANNDGFIYQDAISPALIYQVAAPYSPPNGGRPWGRPIGASLGNMHDLRYPWRTDRSERVLDIPIPAPCDVIFFASVRQNDPATNPTLCDTVDCAMFSALGPEDQFMVGYNEFAQYGAVAGALTFDQNLGEDVP